MTLKTGYIDYVQFFVPGEVWTGGTGELPDEDLPVDENSPEAATPPLIAFSIPEIVITGDIITIMSNPVPNIALTGQSPSLEWYQCSITPPVAAVSVSAPEIAIPDIVFSPINISIAGIAPAIFENLVVHQTPDISIAGIAPGVEGYLTVLRPVSVPGIAITSPTFPSPRLHDPPDWFTGTVVMHTPIDISIEAGTPKEIFIVDFIIDAPTPGISLATQAITASAINAEYTMTLTETIFAWETLDIHRGFPVADAMAMVDSVQVKLILLLNEYISIRDTLTSQWTGNLTVSENLTMVDTASWVRVLYETISEAFAIVDAPIPHLSIILNEYLQVKDAVTAQGVFTKTISETIAMTDTVVVGWLLSLIETMAIADAVTVIKSINETVNETITMTDVLSATGVFNVTVTDTANLSDYAKDCIALYLSESLVMTDGVTCFSEMFLTLSETMGFTEALSVAAETTLSVSENIIFIDSVSSQGVLYNTIQDGFHLDISIELDGEVYECWVLNTPGFYPSIYSGFDFNSYCEYKGVPYGANATGIFKLTGDTDNGAAIHTGAILHSTDFGARNDKRFRKAYIGLSGEAPVMIMEADNGDRIKYAIDSKGKVDASRSVHSRDWILSVGEFDELESIHLVPVILARGK